MGGLNEGDLGQRESCNLGRIGRSKVGGLHSGQCTGTSIVRFLRVSEFGQASIPRRYAPASSRYCLLARTCKGRIS